MKKRTLMVALPDNWGTAKKAMEEAVGKHWPFTPHQFISESEISRYLGDSSYAVMCVFTTLQDVGWSAFTDREVSYLGIMFAAAGVFDVDDFSVTHVTGIRLSATELGIPERRKYFISDHAPIASMIVRFLQNSVVAFDRQQFFSNEEVVFFREELAGPATFSDKCIITDTETLSGKRIIMPEYTLPEGFKRAKFENMLTEKLGNVAFEYISDPRAVELIVDRADPGYLYFHYCASSTKMVNYSVGSLYDVADATHVAVVSSGSATDKTKLIGSRIGLYALLVVLVNGVILGVQFSLISS